MNNSGVPGCEAYDVREVKGLLQAAGYWPHSRSVGERNAVYTAALKGAVRHFQQTNHDAKGHTLKVDGVVGPKTFWALQNWSQGALERAKPLHRPPDGIGDQRARLLRLALGEVGVRERPPGSNRGPDVDRYLPGWSRRTEGHGPAWCCFFASWCVTEAFGAAPWGRTRGSVYSTLQAAEGAGLVIKPTHIEPGDLFVMLHGDPASGDILPGHIGLAYWTEVGRVHRKFSSIEGNCRNAVRISERSTRDIVAGIRTTDRAPRGYERGLIDGALSAPSFAQTR